MLILSLNTLEKNIQARNGIMVLIYNETGGKQCSIKKTNVTCIWLDSVCMVKMHITNWHIKKNDQDFYYGGPLHFQLVIQYSKKMTDP
jgi:hypothetical protein